MEREVLTESMKLMELKEIEKKIDGTVGIDEMKSN